MARTPHANTTRFNREEVSPIRSGSWWWGSLPHWLSVAARHPIGGARLLASPGDVTFYRLRMNLLGMAIAAAILCGGLAAIAPRRAAPGAPAASVVVAHEKPPRWYWWEWFRDRWIAPRGRHVITGSSA